MRPSDCPDYDCDDFADCEECLRMCAEAMERWRNTDWSAMAHSLKGQLLALDSSPEMHRHIALIFDASDAYDAHRLGLVHEPRPEAAVNETESDE